MCGYTLSPGTVPDRYTPVDPTNGVPTERQTEQAQPLLEVRCVNYQPILFRGIVMTYRNLFVGRVWLVLPGRECMSMETIKRAEEIS